MAWSVAGPEAPNASAMGWASRIRVVAAATPMSTASHTPSTPSRSAPSRSPAPARRDTEAVVP